MNEPKHLMLIACAVLHRECYHCASISKNIIDIKLCEKGLHDIGAAKMSARLQAEIDAVPADKYDAILLAYGLCNNGTVGLRAKLPIVIPRAHDCISLLLGSKERYKEYFDKNPGTYYRSSGWIERDSSYKAGPDGTISQMPSSLYQEYADKYGYENAKYLMETLGAMPHYNKMAYIDTHVGNCINYKKQTQADAEERGWTYEEIQGDTGLLQRLMDGPWSENEFLVIEPNHTAQPSFDNEIIKSAPSKDA